MNGTHISSPAAAITSKNKKMIDFFSSFKSFIILIVGDSVGIKN